MARSWLDRLWSHLADREHAFARVPDTADALGRAEALCQALLSETGEASGTEISRELLRTVRTLDKAQRLQFLRFLSTGFAPDPAPLTAAAQAYLENPSPENAHGLWKAAEPPRQELLRRMNMAYGATAFLIELRAEVLKHLRQDPTLRLVADDLQHLLTSWFNRGFLELRSIDMNTPAAILEKIMKYEAVHEVHGWDDLRRRLAPDRRCFGFFHPALPDEPLIFVEVALQNGLAGSIAPILAPAAVYPPADSFDTAIFYSISNCQEGLRGISFGNLLIKQVVTELQAELPRLQTFSTLSPVPSLRAALEKNEELLGDQDAALLMQAVGARSAKEALRALRDEALWNDEQRTALLREPLLRTCARFLTNANDGRGPHDPVARFHLNNGARLERINWLGNVSPRGLSESYGMMVNYLYDLETIEKNHEVFARTGLVARGPAIKELLAPPETSAESVKSAS